MIDHCWLHVPISVFYKARAHAFIEFINQFSNKNVSVRDNASFTKTLHSPEAEIG